MHLHITLNTYWTPLQLASIIECYESLASPVGSPMLYHAFTTRPYGMDCSASWWLLWNSPLPLCESPPSESRNVRL